MMTNEHILLRFELQGKRYERKACDVPNDLEANAVVSVIYAETGQMPSCPDCAAFMSRYKEADILEAMGYFDVKD